MSTELSKPGLLERVLIIGDLSALSGHERIEYYAATCKSLSLNPLTKPFDFIELNNKLTLYAKKDCTDQLRTIRDISVKITAREMIEGVYIVTALAKTPAGREDESTGAVPLMKEGGDWQTSQSGKRFFKGNGQYELIKPEDRANAMMKAETKAKRRVTLSICGLGIIDESELDTVRDAHSVHVDLSTGEIAGPETPTPNATRPAVPPKHSEEQQEGRKAGAARNGSQPAGVSEAVQQLILRMGTKISSVCEVFGELKKDFEEVCGSDQPYYEVLGKHGFAHSNDVRKLGLSKARKCAQELYETLERMKTNLAPPDDFEQPGGVAADAADDKQDWLPDFDAPPVPNPYAGKAS